MLFRSEKVFGKPIGGDIVNGKKSWLTVRILEKTDDRDAFLDIFTRKAESKALKAGKIAAVRNAYVRGGVDTDAKDEIDRFTREALEAVQGVGLQEGALEALRRFADNLVGRTR